MLDIGILEYRFQFALSQIIPAGNMPTYGKKYQKDGKLVICNLQPTKQVQGLHTSSPLNINLFLAVQDSSIGDLVTHSLSHLFISATS